VVVVADIAGRKAGDRLGRLGDAVRIVGVEPHRLGGALARHRRVRPDDGLADGRASVRG